MTLPRIVLVGRMNVGKSTLWNRLTETHGALISSIAGTTRDTREGVVEWRGTRVLLVDTGGIDIPQLQQRPLKKKRSQHGYPEASDPFAAAIERQTSRAVDGAALVLFVVDGKEGLVPQERLWARALLKSRKPTMLVVNKIDAGRHREAIYAFWRIGLGEPLAVSAATGMGTGDLLDRIVTTIRGATAPGGAIVSPSEVYQPIRIALVGRPNVGKSSLVNAILGEERVIVSPIPHTTREPIDTAFTAAGQPFILVDTAGMRKHAHIAPGLERAGVTLTLNALARADIACFVLESHEALGSQDMHIAETIVERRVGCVIIANKWDVFQDVRGQMSHVKGDAIQNYIAFIRKHLPHLHWAPILAVSARTGRNVQRICDTTRIAMAERHRVIPPAALEAFMKKLIYRPSAKNKKMRAPRVYGLKQVGIAPPQFELVTEWTHVMTLHGKQKGTVRDSYVHFVENRIREKFGFVGTPIVLTLRTIEH